MLVIQRKAGEGVHIGPDIRVCVESVREHRNTGKFYVRLSIQCPNDVVILRDELLTGSPQDFQMPDSG